VAGDPPPRGDGLAGNLVTDRVAFELTPREREVATLFLEGHTYKEMSALLFTSVKTLERHVTNMRTKIGASDRASFLAALRQYLER
jgi:DNA-binding CsgD family transcriptional regulator